MYIHQLGTLQFWQVLKAKTSSRHSFPTFQLDWRGKQMKGDSQLRNNLYNFTSKRRDSTWIELLVTSMLSFTSNSGDAPFPYILKFMSNRVSLGPYKRPKDKKQGRLRAQK